MKLENLKICALIPNRVHVYNKSHRNRLKSNDYYGFNIIIEKINIYLRNKIEFVEIDNVEKYDIVLYSLHSIEDFYSLVYTRERKGKKYYNNIWICGGSAISNINPLIYYFNFIFLGRAEALIIPFLNGLCNDNYFEHQSIINTSDYDIYNNYNINYTNKLFEGSHSLKKENMYGCKYNCAYCRYRTATLPPNKRTQDKLTTMPGNEETFWELEIKNGSFYTTSLDGLTEKTRYSVFKKISNKLVIDKLVEASKITKVINLKIYFIIGYPDMNKIDFKEIIEIFKQVDSLVNNCSILLKLHFTPFAAEPHTPMQWEKVNIEIDWREKMNRFKKLSKYLYEGKNVKALILNTTIKPFTLLKRMVFNRFDLSDFHLIQDIGSHPTINSHNTTQNDKLNFILKYHNIDYTINEYKIGTFMPSSNITTWKDFETLKKEAFIVRSNFRKLISSHSSPEQTA